MTNTRIDDPAVRTYWGVVLLLFAAGCSVALHIGKVPAALPVLRDEWQLTLTQSGLIVSLYSLLIAATGIMLGVSVRRIGYIRFAITGVAIVGVGSMAGAYAQGLPMLLLTRTIEGFGWIITVIAFPSLLTALCRPRDRELVMAMWGAFVPLGAGGMLLLAPQLQSFGGWRLSWQFAGFLSLLAAVLVFVLTRQYRVRFNELHVETGRPDLHDLKKPVVWILSACFFFYSFQFTAVTSFLPSLLIETDDWTLDYASRFTAYVIISNALGNVAAGALLRRGVNFQLLLLCGAMGMGICAFIVFNADIALSLRMVSAFAFSILGGLIPGTLFATLSKAASVPAAVGLLIGLMLQCSGAGQLFGGVAFAAAVEHFHSWQAAGVLSLIVTILASLAAVLTCYREFSLSK